MAKCDEYKHDEVNLAAVDLFWYTYLIVDHAYIFINRVGWGPKKDTVAIRQFL